MIEKKKNKVLDIQDIESESFILTRSYLVEKVIMSPLTVFHNCLLISIKLHISNFFKVRK